MGNELVLNELTLVENRLYSLFKADNSILCEILNFLKLPSKRIRSVLALLYLKANNAGINDEIITVLTVGELIHNASLIHDDIIDSADMRRNSQSLNKKFNPKIAVLAGDFLLSLAGKMLISVKNETIIANFYNAAKLMTEAEIKQQLLLNKLPDSNEYIDVCKGKTAALFSVLLESCAVLSDLDTNKAKNLGETFGFLFQLKNDIEPNSAMTDKKNGVNTAMEIFGVEKTKALIHNYKEEILGEVEDFPNIIYRRELEELIRKL